MIDPGAQPWTGLAGSNKSFSKDSSLDFLAILYFGFRYSMNYFDYFDPNPALRPLRKTLFVLSLRYMNFVLLVTLNHVTRRAIKQPPYSSNTL